LKEVTAGSRRGKEKERVRKKEGGRERESEREGQTLTNRRY
jgi:hypothetical protein